ncbi:MAG TPA: neuromedin U [Candidatus Eisenbacteria bacterium]|nr:neuromedin U [Candidatus Eisenbacteria bacterium]
MDGAQASFTNWGHGTKPAAVPRVLMAMTACHSRIGVGRISTLVAHTLRMIAGTRKRSILSAMLICVLQGAPAPSSRAQDVQPVQTAQNLQAVEEVPTGQTTPQPAQVAQPQPTSDAEALEKARKAAQNPIASMISLPIQENWNFGIGPADRVQNVMNIQPVIPISLGEHWNLITRWVTPVVYQPYAVPISQPSGPPVLLQTGAYGFGDIQPQFFFSPKTESKVTWGVGPIFLVPTATQTSLLGQGKFGIGPTFVVLAQPGRWTVGVLANNIWSVAGHADRADVNQFLIEPFINFNLKRAWYLSFSPIMTANWEMTNGGRWVVPLGGGPGRVWKLGHQAVNVQTFFFGNAVHPPGAASWTFRMSFTLLFPKPK